jgi:hypothetical protein
MKIRHLLLSSAIACSLQASVTSYNFAGVIDAISENSNPAFSGVTVGDNISGFFEFDADLPLSSSTYGFSKISITIGGNTITLDHHIYIRGENNYDHYAHGTVDQFTYDFDSAGATTELDPLYVYLLRTSFIDTSASIYAGLADPTLPLELNLTDYDINTWNFRGSDIDTRTQDFNFSGTITSIAVPEPNSALILGIIALPLAFISNRRRANQSGYGQ